MVRYIVIYFSIDFKYYHIAIDFGACLIQYERKYHMTDFSFKNFIIKFY